MLVVSVACAVLAACAYGAATAVEHSAAQRMASTAGGSGLRSTIRLARDRRWLTGFVLDHGGALLHVTALATGPVLLVQPCLVLALPVSLLVAWRLGGNRPAAAQYTSCALLVTGLAAFFVVLGNPGDADPLEVVPTLTTAAILTAAGGAVLVLSGRSRPRAKAIAYGLVAGACAGFSAVLLDAVTADWHTDGIRIATDAKALVTLLLLLGTAIAGTVLVQTAFQFDTLSSSYPADLTANPITAVVLGVLLLHEDIPTSAGDLALFVACLAAIVIGAFRLAAAPTAPARSGA